MLDGGLSNLAPADAFSPLCITGDTLRSVNTVTVRELRNNGGEVIERVLRGERLIVTRDGAPVAEMRARPRTVPSPAELVARRRRLPLIDPDALRRDLDEVIDATL